MASSSNSKRPFCSSSSSSSSSSNSKWRYDVFLSFRGEDTRENFTSHLYKALDNANIKTFKDDEELRKGEEIAPELLKAIEESRIAIIVFSKTYAHSKWCLDELVKIMECQKEKGQIVYPVFYHVRPCEVRNQYGTYGEEFKKHESNADEEKKKKIEEWRTALRKAGNLSGFHLKDDRSEAEFIEEIIGEIRRLIPKWVHVGENIAGMDENLKKVKLLIDAQSNKVSMVGIYGIGGIGKTTIAKVVYNDMLDQFKCHSFLENVREKSEDKDGLLQLQKNFFLSNIGEGIEKIKSKRHSEKVLIVLDDVGCEKQLKFLAPNSECFHPGSIIIVTTRNKRCLDVYDSYSSYEELFCRNAFKQDHPIENFVHLSNRILDYLTAFHWLLYYDGLSDERKKLFLYIACFFKDEDEKMVTRILEGCKFHPKIGLRVLSERCLISIEDNTIRMHDLLQEMGWEIVRKIDPRPGKWSRLWELQDIESVFAQNKYLIYIILVNPYASYTAYSQSLFSGDKNIEGIFINESQDTGKRIQLTAEAFRKMNRLRLLKVEFNQIVQLSQDFELPCHDLVYFHWDYYPLESLPSNFHTDNLVELNLCCSNIKHLWEGNMPAKKLKVIDLSYSRHLVDISSISSMPNLETLILKGCNRLESLPRNLHKLECLQTLSCCGCSNLESFPEIEEEMRSLRKLNLSHTGIMGLPSSIRHLNGLEDLDLSSCNKLLSLPDSIYSLSSLRTLNLVECSKLVGFPDINIGSLKALEYLDLSWCENLESLPNSIGRLSSLQTLLLMGCSKLKGFLDINFGSLKALEWLDFSHCRNLESFPHDCFSSLEALNPQCPLSSLVELSVRNSYHMEEDILSGSFYVSSLEILSLGNFPSVAEGILDKIFHLSSLVKLSLTKCKLKEEGIPSDIRNLSPLQQLSLHDCNLMEGKILNHICHLTSLEELYLGWNHFSSIPAGISRLSNLKALDLSHCKNLQQIPELPSSLRFLDAHCSDGISSSPSLLPIHSMREVINSYSSFFGNGISIVIPRSSGILEWITCQNMGRHEVTIKLPPNWYKNDDLWGFALYCVAPAYESEDESQYESGLIYEDEDEDEDDAEHEDEEARFYCGLTIEGNNQSEDVDYFVLYSRCVKYDVSDMQWVICYPKLAIEKSYHTNQWTHFKASFYGAQVEECGIRLVYTEDYEQKQPTMAQGSTSHGNFGDHGLEREALLLLDTNSKAHNKRNPTEQSLGEESHHKRFRETQD
ncbi:hypothetical protein AAG906_017994 [Vitis piasezkii]